jgi:hypothetical protein
MGLAIQHYIFSTTKTASECEDRQLVIYRNGLPAQIEPIFAETIYVFRPIGTQRELGS